MTRQFILTTNSPLIYWILDATAERDRQILMQFIYRNQANLLTIDPAIRLQVLSHNLSRPTLFLMLQPHNSQISYSVQLWGVMRCPFVVIIYTHFTNWGRESFRKYFLGGSLVTAQLTPKLL
jgi:formate-dependent nitrite reductase membrane component NrfD